MYHLSPAMKENKVLTRKKRKSKGTLKTEVKKYLKTEKQEYNFCLLALMILSHIKDKTLSNNYKYLPIYTLLYWV